VWFPDDAITFRGEPKASHGELSALPLSLQSVLSKENGFIAWHGALHMRGLGTQFIWHDLNWVWRGSNALASGYRSLRPSDVPFAQDCLGMQFVLRDDVVFRLDTECDELENLGIGIPTFLERVMANPDEMVHRHVLRSLDLRLRPGELLSVAPPLVFAHQGPRSYRPIPCVDQLSFLASLASQIRDVPDGGQVSLKVVP
jgi:hypothetical protein